MTNKNSTIKEPSLEDRLLQIGSLSQISRGIERSRSPSERLGLYQNLAGILSGGDGRLFKDSYGDIRVSPEEAVRYAAEGTQTRIKDAESLYEKDKGRIVEEVISAMKKDLQSAKTIDEAAGKLSEYLRGLYGIPELDQVTADGYEQQEVARRLGVSMNYSARGSIEKYRGSHEALVARTIAREEFIKEEKEGDKVIGYRLDKDKITKAMDNIGIGALLYSNTQNIKEMKKKIEEKKAKQNQLDLFD
ncbi:MAG: hypothetical protein ISS82_06280 [Nanoarchaeota archaeon]|nr:hypothetical protein [Nanoarchaeota archaeon]